MSYLDLPILIKKDSEYLPTLSSNIVTYIRDVENLKTLPHLSSYISYIDQAVFDIKRIRTTLKRAFNAQFTGKSQSGIKSIVKLIKKYEKKLVSPILDSYAFRGNDYYYRPDDSLKELYLFKGRIGNPFETYPFQDMLHIPLNLRSKTSTQRYSMPGVPCIYLAQNSYIVWNEMKKPSLDTLSISAFKISENMENELKIIDLTYPLKNVMGILKDADQFSTLYDNRSAPIVISSLALWPLIASVSVKCEEQNRSFKSEYVIPQLLMYCLKNDLVGIAYRSVEISSAGTELLANNLAIPIIDFKQNKKYGNIKNSILVSDSINFDFFAKVCNNQSFLNELSHHGNQIPNNTRFRRISQPFSTFNSNLLGQGASYDGLIEYQKTPFYMFDEFLIYTKDFYTIQE